MLSRDEHDALWLAEHSAVSHWQALRLMALAEVAGWTREQVCLALERAATASPTPFESAYQALSRGEPPPEEG